MLKKNFKSSLLVYIHYVVYKTTPLEKRTVGYGPIGPIGPFQPKSSLNRFVNAVELG